MKISIIGSTGSIGRQAIEVVRNMPGFFEVISLTGGDNIEELRKQIKLTNIYLLNLQIPPDFFG